MISPRVRLALACVSMAAGAFGLEGGKVAHAGSCYEAVDEATAKALFDRLTKIHASDGCVLENVATEQSAVRVGWKKGTIVEEPIVVVPASCAAHAEGTRKLAASVPLSTASACPKASDATLDAVASFVAPTLVKVETATTVPVVIERPPFPWRLLVEVLGGVVSAVGAAFGAIHWHRRRKAAALDRGVSLPEALPHSEELVAGGPLGGPLPGKPRARWERNPTRAGWGAALLLAPHLALGTWLLLVPDHVAFTAAQVVTLIHVGLALLAFPLVGLWTFVHVRRMRTARPQGPATVAASKVLTLAVVLAAGTGLAVLYGGDITRLAPLHAATGVLVGVPLAFHLWGSPRRFAGGAVLGLLGLTALAAWGARGLLPTTTAEPRVPDFAYTTRDASLYEPAASCGECHTADYADWKRSTHARTLSLPNVQESLGHAKDILGVTLTEVGALREDPKPPPTAAVTLSTCGACHAPTTFYGNDKQSMLSPAGVVAEGVGCSFCHTLRAVHESPPFDTKDLASGDVFQVMSRVPLYVSAPETVRRYLFQGSTGRWRRRLSNLLIRWRPDVHSRDYESPVLKDSRACLVCHSLGVDSASLPHMTYYGWKVSPFVTKDAKTTVECQDCHMTSHMTGHPTSDPGRMVPWGPVRPKTRSHLLVGGNVRAADELRDPDLALRQHDLNAAALDLTVSAVDVHEDGLDATVAVRSSLVGHFFPALETQLRYGWVELEAHDASGAVVAKTERPRDSQDFGSSSPFIMASTDDPKPGNQRLVAPRSTREFAGHLALPKGTKVTTLVARLWLSIDPTPIATATWALAASEPRR